MSCVRIGDYEYHGTTKSRTWTNISRTCKPLSQIKNCLIRTSCGQLRLRYALGRYVKLNHYDFICLPLSQQVEDEPLFHFTLHHEVPCYTVPTWRNRLALAHAWQIGSDSHLFSINKHCLTAKMYTSYTMKRALYRSLRNNVVLIRECSTWLNNIEKIWTNRFTSASHCFIKSQVTRPSGLPLLNLIKNEQRKNSDATRLSISSLVIE